jgi:hypothetical protein
VEQPQLVGERADHLARDPRILIDPLAQRGQRVHQEVRLQVLAHELGLEPRGGDQRAICSWRSQSCCAGPRRSRCSPI